MKTLREYSNNPCIEALGHIPSPGDWVQRLTQLPTFDPSERQLPPHVRLHAVMRLQDFFFPLPSMIHIAERLDMMLRRGYVGRNPLTPQRVQLLEQVYQGGGSATAHYAAPPTGVSTFSLIGSSGMGKTSALERALANYPQVVVHEELGLTQVVWLKINVPPDASVSGLILGFFNALRTALNDPNIAREANQRTTKDKLLELMKQYAASYSVGVIVVDELQNLTVRKSQGRSVLLNALEALCNEVKVPEMLVGTMKARRLLDLDFRHARKSVATGALFWEPLKPGREWDMFLRELWRFQWTDEEVPLTDEWSAYMHEATQGVIALVPLVFALAQMRVIAYRKKSITQDIIDTVMNNELKAVQPMIRALRRNDPRSLLKYEDIWPTNLYDMLEEQRAWAETTAASKRNRADGPVATPAQQAVLSLEHMGYPPDVAEAAVAKVSEGTSLTSRQIVPRALALLAQVEREDEMPEDDIRHELQGSEPNLAQPSGGKDDPLCLGDI